MRSGDPSSGAGRGRRAPSVDAATGLVLSPKLSLADLLAVEFPRRDAVALLDAFAPCASRVVDQQKSSSGGVKLVRHWRGLNAHNTPTEKLALRGRG